MKRISQVLSLFLLLTAATAMAQGPTSFRNIATGGTIDDNLDRAYDPIELRFVEGIHFYTNLSNLTSSNEKLLNNVSDHEFLFGVSLPNPWVDNLWTAVGFQMENSENSNFVAIDPDWGFGTMPQENGFGQLNYNYFAILDTDFDGTYDQQQTIFQEVTDYTTNDSYSFSLNNSYLTDMGTFGVMIARDKREMTGDLSSAGNLGTGAGPLSQYAAGSQTFDRSIAIHDIGGAYDITEWSENGAFETTNTLSNTLFNLAYMTEWNQYEVRGDFGFNSESDLMEGSDRYHGEVVNNDPTISGYNDTYWETATFEEKQNEEGSSFMLGGSIRETFQPGSSRLTDGFWQVGAGIQFGGCDYEASDASRFTSEEDYFDGDNSGGVDFVETVTASELASDDGTADDFGFGLWGVYNRQLSDNLTFGFGAGWNHNSTNRSTDFVVRYREVTDYNFVDAASDDWVRTETEQFSADRSWERTTTTFNCPVGIEYRTGKRDQWAWRCGSRFTRTSVLTTDDLQAVGSQCTPYTTEVNYDSAPDTETINNTRYGSSKEEIHSTISTSTFYYGLGYMPTENLQIDLIYIFAGGFDLLDSDFFRDLRISITLNN